VKAGLDHPRSRNQTKTFVQAYLQRLPTKTQKPQITWFKTPNCTGLKEMFNYTTDLRLEGVKRLAEKQNSVTAVNELDKQT